uniref:Uncharacterized protein LOC104214731 n=1 Tax=Nicotiana sylvestris TaxID=4096 RepID=A0A1U7V3E0_NICSY|nr:PREDICTED: uncharacterized protein LOC104214731 [Nicotiana sylvestris]
MGFGGRWINGIKYCISIVSFSVLINGAPAGFFPSQRGMRQGDPFSPFLFIIAMEGLNDMLKRAQTNNWIRGFKVNCRADSNMRISHLQYADDTLVFCEADREQLKVLRVIFILFEATSGLRINWYKSFIYPVNEVMELQSLAGILGGNVGEMPTVYLGMPFGAKSKSKGIWNGVLEKCEKKLANWKNHDLSMGGRLTLINSVLDVLPTYMMSLFPIPVNVVKRIDALRRNFLWEGNSEKKKFHLVNWSSVTTSKKAGRLGIKT